MIRFFYNILSILNIFIINFKIFFIKKIQKKKIAFFYHPKKRLTLNNLNFIISYFSQKKNFYFIYGSKLLIDKKNFYLIKQIYLKFLFGIDIFLSNNVCDKFSPKSVKVYIHHDIYDTPLVEKKKEKNLKLSFLKYNYIVVASKKSTKVFTNLFKNLSSKPKILIFKYLKINFIKKKLSQNKLKSDHILIAPTNYLSFPKFTIQRKLYELIDRLLNHDYKVIYRPHPSNFKDRLVVNLKSKFEDRNNFIFDDNPEYFNSYKKSKFLITDLSGTAYTFAITTGRPVIFFNHNDKHLKKYNYNELNYFIDRDKVGWKFENISKIINFLKNNKKFESQKLLKLKKFKKIFYGVKKFDLNYLLKYD